MVLWGPRLTFWRAKISQFFLYFDKKRRARGWLFPSLQPGGVRVQEGTHGEKGHSAFWEEKKKAGKGREGKARLAAEL